MLDPQRGLNFEAPPDIVRDPEPKGNGGFRGEFSQLSEADLDEVDLPPN
jgi:hypothetical protein